MYPDKSLHSAARGRHLRTNGIEGEAPSSPAALVLVAATCATVLGCNTEIALLPVEPELAVPESAVAEAAAGTSGLSVRLSPRYVSLYTTAGAARQTIRYSAQLVDSAGAPQALARGDVGWSTARGFGGVVRWAGEGLASDGVTAWMDAEVVRRGRDTIMASAGGATAGQRGAVAAWEWTRAVTRKPAVWTRIGESRCAEVGAEGADGAVSLADFQHLFASSLDPETVTVDSTTLATGGEVARICVTGRKPGTGRIALVGLDTLALRYVGSYEQHHVLTEPLAFGVEHERWEIGRGERARVGTRITDATGRSVALPSSEVRTWRSSDDALVAVDAGTGEMTGVASGSARVSATFVGQTAAVDVDVYEIASVGVALGVVCVLTRRGTVRCFGDGDQPTIGYGLGRLGAVDGPDVGDVPLGGRAKALFMRSQSACALMEAREIRCWGDSSSGQIGYGVPFSVGDNETPAQAGPVPVGGPVIGAGRGDYRGCVIIDGGTLRCWGANEGGQLGYGSAVPDLVVGDDETVVDIGDVPVGGRVVQVDGARLWTCALLDTGRVRCWGINAERWDRETGEFGQSYGIGYGPAHGFTSPVGDDETPAEVGDLPLPGRAVKIALSGYHACALMEDGAVRCWGFNGYGALGHGRGGHQHIGDDETAANTVPLRFPGTVADIGTGYFHSCALLDTGEVYCWGLRDRGPLGYGNASRIGDDEPAAAAGPVPLAEPAEALFVNGYSTCAVLRSGLLSCWGNTSDLSFNTLHVGDDETPADVDPVQVFPGAVPAWRPGRAEAAADIPRVAHPALMLFTRDGAAPMPGAATSELPFQAPLAGPGGVLPPDSVAGPTRWLRIVRRDR